MIEMRIFNSILHGGLRPVESTNYEEKEYRLLLTKEFTSPTDYNVYYTSLKEILSDHPSLFLEEEIEIYLKQADGDFSPRINNILVDIESPVPFSSISRFYFYLILNETTRLSRNIIVAVCKDLMEEDRKYIVRNSVSEIKDLLRNITKVKSSISTEFALGHFVIKVLQNQVIRLLLEVELLFNEFLKYPTSTDEEIFLELLNEPCPEVPYYKTTNDFQKLRDRIMDYLFVSSNTVVQQSDKLSFGYNGDKDTLKSILVLLNSKIDLLKREKTTVDDLYMILTTKNIVSTMNPVYLECKTNKFAYIMKKMQIHFSDLSFKNIEESHLFFSSTGTPLKANNLSSSIPKGDFELKEEIDKILINLQ